MPDTIPMQNTLLLRRDDEPVHWQISEAPVCFHEALAAMKDQIANIRNHGHRERVWLLEHPALYSAGTSAKETDLKDPDYLPVYKSGRGGQYTYHGPGQRVVYLMLDLRARGRDIHALVRALESLVINILGRFNIAGYRIDGQVGVWVDRPDKGPGRRDKIAAIGIRVSRWVSFHGLSINLDPNLDHYGGIVPCGIADQGVTSFEDLGYLVTMPELDAAIRACFERQFGSTTLLGLTTG